MRTRAIHVWRPQRPGHGGEKRAPSWLCFSWTEGCVALSLRRRLCHTARYDLSGTRYLLFCLWRFISGKTETHEGFLREIPPPLPAQNQEKKIPPFLSQNRSTLPPSPLAPPPPKKRLKRTQQGRNSLGQRVSGDGIPRRLELGFHVRRVIPFGVFLRGMGHGDDRR